MNHIIWYHWYHTNLWKLKKCRVEAQEVTIARAVMLKHKPSLIAALAMSTRDFFSDADKERFHITYFIRYFISDKSDWWANQNSFWYRLQQLGAIKGPQAQSTVSKWRKYLQLKGKLMILCRLPTILNSNKNIVLSSRNLETIISCRMLTDIIKLLKIIVCHSNKTWYFYHVLPSSFSQWNVWPNPLRKKQHL